MKISVVGTFVRDIIYPWQSSPVKSIGGIFYTISYLANLAGQDNEIWPVCYIGEDFYDQVVRELRKFGNVRTDCMRRLARENTTVKLEYIGPTEREETTTEPMPEIQSGDLELIMDSDTTIVNLITGTDLHLDALKHFRQTSGALIYLDLHSRTLGIDENGKRYLRKPDDWVDWFRHADIVQMNESEAYLLGGEPHQPNSLVKLGKKILDVNPSICHITLAERGSYLFYRNEQSRKFLEINACRINDVVDVIGCGDAFEAAFSLHYLKNRDVVAATRFAHIIAGENCRFYGSSGIGKIKKYMAN
jgi:sugar/nucleoside kinase (ribokinase family)